MFVFSYDDDEVGDNKDDEHLGVTHVDDVAQIQLPPNSQRLIDLRSLVVLRRKWIEQNFISKVSNSWSIWRFHYYMVVSVVLQPCDPQVRVDRVDDGDEEEEQAQERLHATEVEWRMINTSDYKAVFV